MRKENCFFGFLLRKPKVLVRPQDIESERLNILRWSHEKDGGRANVVFKNGKQCSYPLPEESEQVLRLFEEGSIKIMSYTNKKNYE